MKINGQDVRCPNTKCRSSKIHRAGQRATKKEGMKQRLYCTQCATTFYYVPRAARPKKSEKAAVAAASPAEE